MAWDDLRGRRWLPPLGVAALVALTVLDVVLVKLAFDHAAGPAVPDGDPRPATGSRTPGASASATASTSPTATPTTSPGATGSPARVPADGPALLALGTDGTVLRATTGGCGTDDPPAQVALARTGSGTFRAVPVAPGLEAVLAVQAERRDRLVVVGAASGCEVAAYRGGAGGGGWTAGPARGEWYLDPTAEGADTPVVHAPGGAVEVPCTPAALSTLGAVRVLCDDGALLGTSDGGSTWVALGRLEDASAVAFQGPGSGVALAPRDACPVTVLTTDDGGSSWETAACLDGQQGRAVALRDQSLVAVVDDTVWRSDDGGVTWGSPG